MSMSSFVAEQNIIIVSEDEFHFFEIFTKKNKIYWTYEDRKNRILRLSRSYVGCIITPTRVIELKPKYHELELCQVIRMYKYVKGYKPTDNASILDVSDDEKSIDVADMFIKNLKQNIREGIIRTYERREIRASAIKGCVDYTKTYIGVRKNNHRPVFATLSSLSINNDYNSLILSALRKLQHIGKYSGVASELSVYFIGANSKVSNGSELLSKINFNSNTSRFRNTLTYAAMIIDQLSYNDDGLAAGGYGFLINFDRLFEEFVAKILKEVPEKREFSTWKGKRNFADVICNKIKQGEREYQPDILYRFIEEDEQYEYAPSAYAVLDVKNKAYNQFKNADVYQILTYSKLLHSKKAVLLYPSFQQKSPETLALDENIFFPSIISACFINIAEKSGADFLNSIHLFANTVLKTVLSE